MTTVGEILKSHRVEKKLTLAEVEKATHIRLKYLDALEKGRYDLLPAKTFTRGLVQNYAAYLAINTEEILAFYRRETSREDLLIPIRQIPRIRKFILTPKIFLVAGTILLIGLFFVYLAVQYFAYAGKPALEVVQPADFSIVSQAEITVSGKTDPSAILTLNQKQLNFDELGNFAINIPLSPGLNVLTIVAENKFKKQSTIIRHVRLESP